MRTFPEVEVTVQTIRLEVNQEVEFDEARAVAAGEAATRIADPMLLAWLNRITGRHSPDLDCCQAEGKETWEIYAESRGGSLRIESGDRYVFVFREGLQAR